MKIAALVVGLLLVCAVAAYAQGPFADVPTDHWAYEAVNQLQQDGILIGYPDGTFGGKRAMTRYEFAVAIARMIPIIRVTPPVTGEVPSLENYVTKDELANELKNYATKAELANYCTKADCEAIRKLVDEFRDELAALGVDVDALKRDVAALNDRVTALEKEVARVHWTGDVQAIVESASIKGAAPQSFDRDDRRTTNTDMARNISALENVDLNVVGRLTDTASANINLVGGNYLSWIGTVDDYSVFTRPDSKFTGLADKAALWYGNADWAICKGGRLVMGRQPIQWTPYTLKMIDVDSYTDIYYTDNGDYPMDAARLQLNFKGVKIDAFGAKNNENPYVKNGLTAQPTSGLYNNALPTPPAVSPYGLPVPPVGPFNVLGGHAAGGLAFIDQSAGVRLQIGTPWKGNLAGSYIRAAGSDARTGLTGAPLPAVAYDQVDMYGADLNINLGNFPVSAQWAQTTTLGINGAADIDEDNTALDATIGFVVGKFGLDAGWKRVERNFAAPGYWDKLGRWTNPTNIEGPYGGLTFGITPNVSVIADAAFYSGVDNFGDLPLVINNEDDNILHVNGGLKWGISSTNSVVLGVEWVQWDPSGATEKTDEFYYNFGWGYQFNPSAGFKLQYQIVSYQAGTGVVPYGFGDYRENIAVGQFGVKF